MKKITMLILMLVFLSGCFFVVRNEDKIKVFGENKETALDAVKKTDETKPEDKREVLRFLDK